MSLKNWLLGNPIAETVESIESLITTTRSALTGELPPATRVKLEEKLIELEKQKNEAQTRINAAEAKHPSIFIAGWRPAVGWVCVIGVFIQFIVYPLVKIVHSSLAPIDMTQLIALLVSLLGLGAYRTYEKKVGVQGEH